jgi:WD40 repeat protein
MLAVLGLLPPATLAFTGELGPRLTDKHAPADRHFAFRIHTLASEGWPANAVTTKVRPIQDAGRLTKQSGPFGGEAVFLTRTSAGSALRQPGDRDGDPLSRGALQRLGSTKWRHGAPIRTIACSRDGSLVITAGDDRWVRLWDAHSGKQRAAVPLGEHGDAARVLVSPAADFVGFPDRHRIAVALTATGEVKHIEASRVGGYLVDLALSPDGRTLASVTGTDKGGTVTLWDAKAARELRKIKLSPDFPFRVVFPANNQVAVMCLTDQFPIRLRRFEVGTGKEAAKPLPIPLYELRYGRWATMAMSTDGKQLAFSMPNQIQPDRAGYVISVDLISGRQFVRAGLPFCHHCPAAFSPDGKTLAVVTGLALVQTQAAFCVSGS